MIDYRSELPLDRREETRRVVRTEEDVRRPGVKVYVVSVEPSVKNSRTEPGSGATEPRYTYPPDVDGDGG